MSPTPPGCRRGLRGMNPVYTKQARPDVTYVLLPFSGLPLFRSCTSPLFRSLLPFSGLFSVPAVDQVTRTRFRTPDTVSAKRAGHSHSCDSMSSALVDPYASAHVIL